MSDIIGKKPLSEDERHIAELEKEAAIERGEDVEEDDEEKDDEEDDDEFDDDDDDEVVE